MVLVILKLRRPELAYWVTVLKKSDVNNEYVTDTVGYAIMESMERVYGSIYDDEVIQNELDESA